MSAAGSNSVPAAFATLPRRCWRGELPLSVTYWLLGVGGNAGFALLFWGARVAARVRRTARLPGLAYGASLFWFVFIFGAIWRSAGRYRGPPAWRRLARLGVLSGVLRMAVELALSTAVAMTGTSQIALRAHSADRQRNAEPRLPAPG